MSKLVDISVKNFGHTLGSILDSTKRTAELYKNDSSTIDDPNSLDELWKMVEECEDTKEAVDKLLGDMNDWYDKHLIDFRSMLGFSLQPLWGSVGLTLSSLMEKK